MKSQEHTQRALEGLLRQAIDRAERDGRAWRTVDALIEHSPHNAVSTHVLYNLGRRRAAVVVSRARPLFFARQQDAEVTRYDLPLNRDASLVDDHEPREPFIRVTWRKNHDGGWTMGSTYCSLCRLRVALLVPEEGGPGTWIHADREPSSY